MVSHDKSDTFSVSIKGGVRFKKAAGAFATCVGNYLDGVVPRGPGTAPGGRYNVQRQDMMWDAAKHCNANVTKPKPSTRKGK